MPSGRKDASLLTWNYGLEPDKGEPVSDLDISWRQSEG